MRAPDCQLVTYCADLCVRCRSDAAEVGEGCWASVDGLLEESVEEHAAGGRVAPVEPEGVLVAVVGRNADVGKSGVAANGRTYVCGAKGADANGHDHWNA